jgi:hypothetical protein
VWAVVLLAVAWLPALAMALWSRRSSGAEVTATATPEHAMLVE